MLSAIAARNARLSSTKRTHTHTAGANSPAKKARKSASRSKNDITTTVSKASNSSTSKEENAFSLDDSDDDSKMSITFDQPPLEPTPRERTKAYSPSRPVVPVVDSSNDASDASDSEQPLTDLSQLFSYNRPSPNGESQILSTYRPIHGQNLFQLYSDEKSALVLNGPAIALVLSPSSTVSFVGAYRLRVLRGAISLLGTIIPPSRVLHRVFVPRSSPIPMIEALAAHGESPKSLYGIPAQITSVIDEGDVVIVLQELRTGIEGLGRVMRTFEGVFRHADPEGAPDIPLGGVDFVCFFRSSRRLTSLTQDPRYLEPSAVCVLFRYHHHGRLLSLQRHLSPQTRQRACLNLMPFW